MALRKPPPPDVDPNELRKKLEQSDPAAGWHRYRCKLVTPLYGGGVEAGEVDKAMPIRATAIRGQLRYWWRIAQRQRFIHNGKLDHQAMFRRERELWGGLGDAGELAASKVVVRMDGPVRNVSVEPAARYGKKPDGSYKAMPDWEPWAEGYALFPAQGKANRSGVEKPPRKLLKPGAEWDMVIHLERLDDAQRQEVETAIRWWASFGGVGARTRRGLGALAVSQLERGGSSQPLTVISQQEAKEAGLMLVFRGNPTDDPVDAWKKAIKAMRSFRQGEGIGRNPGQERNRPGRSRWPEPDAIRRHAGKHSSNHAPTHPAGKRFPRAAFGLPIIFHFKDKDDPGDATLSPKGKERMASPLILRPYRLPDGRWRAAALRLPYGHVQTMDVSLKVERVGKTLDMPAGEWWPLFSDEAGRKSAASAVSPISLTGNPTEPLSAFLTFFQKPDLAKGGN